MHFEDIILVYMLLNPLADLLAYLFQVSNKVILIKHTTLIHHMSWHYCDQCIKIFSLKN